MVTHPSWQSSRFFYSMVFLFILAFASLLFPLLAAPANGDRDDPIVVPHSDPSKFTCQCNAPAVSSYYCPPRGSNLDRTTPLGLAHGVADPNGALRFAVRYGTAVRWQPSSMVTAWDLPYVQFHLEELKHTDLVQ